MSNNNRNSIFSSDYPNFASSNNNYFSIPGEKKDLSLNQNLNHSNPQHHSTILIEQTGPFNLEKSQPNTSQAETNLNSFLKKLELSKTNTSNNNISFSNNNTFEPSKNSQNMSQISTKDPAHDFYTNFDSYKVNNLGLNVAQKEYNDQYNSISTGLNLSTNINIKQSTNSDILNSFSNTTAFKPKIDLLVDPPSNSSAINIHHLTEKPINNNLLKNALTNSNSQQHYFDENYNNSLLSHKINSSSNLSSVNNPSHLNYSNENYKFTNSLNNNSFSYSEKPLGSSINSLNNASSQNYNFYGAPTSNLLEKQQILNNRTKSDADLNNKNKFLNPTNLNDSVLQNFEKFTAHNQTDINGSSIVSKNSYLTGQNFESVNSHDIPNDIYSKKYHLAKINNKIGSISQAELNHNNNLDSHKHSILLFNSKNNTKDANNDSMKSIVSNDSGSFSSTSGRFSKFLTQDIVLPHFSANLESIPKSKYDDILLGNFDDLSNNANNYHQNQAVQGFNHPRTFSDYSINHTDYSGVPKQNFSNKNFNLCNNNDNSMHYGHKRNHLGVENSDLTQKQKTQQRSYLNFLNVYQNNVDEMNSQAVNHQNEQFDSKPNNLNNHSHAKVNINAFDFNNVNDSNIYSNQNNSNLNFQIPHLTALNNSNTNYDTISPSTIINVSSDEALYKSLDNSNLSNNNFQSSDIWHNTNVTNAPPPLHQNPQTYSSISFVSNEKHQILKPSNPSMTYNLNENSNLYTLKNNSNSLVGGDVYGNSVQFNQKPITANTFDNYTSNYQLYKLRKKEKYKNMSLIRKLVQKRATSLISTLVFTVNLVDFYQAINPKFIYKMEQRPKRSLTKPSEGALNDGYDNINSDYILNVDESIIGPDGSEYIIMESLGSGTFGQVVKCLKSTTGEHVAVKVVKNKPAYFEQSMMEVHILKELKDIWDVENKHNFIRHKEHFYFRNHLCIVNELLSINLYELLKKNNYKGLSTTLIRVLTTQILDSMCVLKSAKIIHCDLKPENILLERPDQTLIKIIDFGSACYQDQTMYTYIQSRFYRSPEVLIGLPYSLPIDMWSVGCIVAELFLGLPIFPGTSEFNQVSRIVELLGVPPVEILETAQRKTYFFKRIGSNKWRIKTIEEFSKDTGISESIGKKYFPADNLFDLITQYPHKPNIFGSDLDVENSNRVVLVDFLKGLLDLNPKTRFTPEQAMAHPFISHNYSSFYNSRQDSNQSLPKQPTSSGNSSLVGYNNSTTQQKYNSSFEYQGQNNFYRPNEYSKNFTNIHPDLNSDKGSEKINNDTQSSDQLYFVSSENNSEQMIINKSDSNFAKNKVFKESSSEINLFEQNKDYSESNDLQINEYKYQRDNVYSSDLKSNKSFNSLFFNSDHKTHDQEPATKNFDNILVFNQKQHQSENLNDESSMLSFLSSNKEAFASKNKGIVYNDNTENFLQVKSFKKSILADNKRMNNFDITNSVNDNHLNNICYTSSINSSSTNEMSFLDQINNRHKNLEFGAEPSCSSYNNQIFCSQSGDLYHLNNINSNLKQLNNDNPTSDKSLAKPPMSPKFSAYSAKKNSSKLYTNAIQTSSTSSDSYNYKSNYSTDYASKPYKTNSSNVEKLVQSTIAKLNTNQSSSMFSSHVNEPNYYLKKIEALSNEIDIEKLPKSDPIKISNNLSILPLRNKEIFDQNDELNFSSPIAMLEYRTDYKTSSSDNNSDNILSKKNLRTNNLEVKNTKANKTGYNDKKPIYGTSHKNIRLFKETQDDFSTSSSTSQQKVRSRKNKKSNLRTKSLASPNSAAVLDKYDSDSSDSCNFKKFQLNKNLTTVNELIEHKSYSKSYSNIDEDSLSSSSSSRLISEQNSYILSQKVLMEKLKRMGKWVDKKDTENEPISNKDTLYTNKNTSVEPEYSSFSDIAELKFGTPTTQHSPKFKPIVAPSPSTLPAPYNLMSKSPLRDKKNQFKSKEKVNLNKLNNSTFFNFEVANRENNRTHTFHSPLTEEKIPDSEYTNNSSRNHLIFGEQSFVKQPASQIKSNNSEYFKKDLQALNMTNALMKNYEYWEQSNKRNSSTKINDVNHYNLIQFTDHNSRTNYPRATLLEASQDLGLSGDSENSSTNSGSRHLTSYFSDMNLSSNSE
ncbi:hypothetical protein BB561_005448, partial [Smittium simulii]